MLQFIRCGFEIFILKLKGGIFKNVIKQKRIEVLPNLFFRFEIEYYLTYTRMATEMAKQYLIQSKQFLSIFRVCEKFSNVSVLSA